MSLTRSNFFIQYSIWYVYNVILQHNIGKVWGLVNLNNTHSVLISKDKRCEKIEGLGTENGLLIAKAGYSFTFRKCRIVSVRCEETALLRFPLISISGCL